MRSRTDLLPNSSSVSGWTPHAAWAELPHVLMLPAFNRAARIGGSWAEPQSRQFAELLIDLQEDRHARAVVVGMLRHHDRHGRWEA
jgi:hypothetical protein